MVWVNFYVSIDIDSNVSFYKGMTEFQEGEVSVICRKIILIHGQGPGFCYLQVKRFKWGFSQVLMNTTIFEFEFPSTGICFWFWTWFSCRPMTMKQGLSQPITASLHHCGRGGAVNYTQINQHNKRREIWIRTFTSSSGLQEILIWSGCLRNSKTQDLGHESKYFFCISRTPRLPKIPSCLSKMTH